MNVQKLGKLRSKAEHITYAVAVSRSNSSARSRKRAAPAEVSASEFITPRSSRRSSRFRSRSNEPMEEICSSSEDEVSIDVPILDIGSDPGTPAPRNLPNENCLSSLHFFLFTLSYQLYCSLSLCVLFFIFVHFYMHDLVREYPSFLFVCLIFSAVPERKKFFLLYY